MKRTELAILTGIVLSIFLSSFTSFAKECGEIRSESLRLHILANSDSREDQALKLLVRDRILAESPELFAGSGSKDEAKRKAQEKLAQIERIAKSEIKNAGYDYNVKAEIANMYFDTKAYGDITMPAGRYDAVRVYIGEAKGQNWWCVLFPPLCIPAAGEKQPIEEKIENLDEEPRYVPKLMLVEVFEKLTDSGENDKTVEQ